MARLVLLIAAIVCFALAAFGVNDLFDELALVPLGLALGFTAFVVGAIPSREG